MTLRIQLLGPPRVLIDGRDQAKPRGAKTWALLALLSRSERPLPRTRIAELLFPDADDPLGALRWVASELRRLLGPGAAVEGDPLVLELPDSAVLDVDLVLRGRWQEVVDFADLGRPFLEDVDPRAGAQFELWLAGERRHLQGAAAASIHEAGAVLLSRGETDRAVSLAEQLVAVDPLDENAHVLLTRCLVAAGRHEAAADAVADCTELFRSELGAEPSPALASALRRRVEPVRASRVTLLAQLEAGQAAMNAGAVDAGLETLRGVTEGAQTLGDDHLAAAALVALGVALVHTARGTDEEAVSVLHRARDLAETTGDRACGAAAARELGYVDMLRGRYERALVSLDDARVLAGGDPAELAWVELFHGSCLSDTAHYPEGETALRTALTLAEEAGQNRNRAFALTHLGRLLLLRGELEEAENRLEDAIATAQQESWTAFVPYPETWMALVELARGRVADSQDLFEHAWAMACQIGDVCWQTLALRGLGLVSAGDGRIGESLDQLSEAPGYCRRMPDAYRWAEAYALEALVDTAVGSGDGRARGWLTELDDLAARHGFRELQVRAQVHKSRLGDADAWHVAALLGAEIDNPVLTEHVDRHRPAG